MVLLQYYNYRIPCAFYKKFKINIQNNSNYIFVNISRRKCTQIYYIHNYILHKKLYKIENFIHINYEENY